MGDRLEGLVRESERLYMVTKYVEKCMDEKYQVIDKTTLCMLLGIECKERGIDE